MLRSAVLCFILLQVATSEAIDCNDPPKLNDPLECCPLPDVFNVDDMKECGIPWNAKDKENLEKVANDTPVDTCNKLKCIFKKNNLMKDDTNVDKDAVLAYMNKWVESNPKFKGAVEVAINNCIKEDLEKKNPLVFNLCQPNIYLYCAGVSVYSNCPIWTDNSLCKEVKEYIDECKPLDF